MIEQKFCDYCGKELCSDEEQCPFCVDNGFTGDWARNHDPLQAEIDEADREIMEELNKQPKKEESYIPTYIVGTPPSPPEWVEQQPTPVIKRPNASEKAGKLFKGIGKGFAKFAVWAVDGDIFGRD